MVTEGTALLASAGAGDEAKVLFRNFILMAVAFGMHHGAVLTCLGLSSTTVREATAAMGNSVLYVMFALMTLVGATGVLAILGLKRTLLVTAALMACYPLSYLVSTLKYQDGQFTTGAVVTGGVLCGVAMGPYWAAQGVFYARSAAAHGMAAGTDVEVTNSQFASIFAATLLGFELLLKVAASAVLWNEDYELDTALMAALFALSLVPIFALFFLYEPPDLVPAPATAVSSPGEMAAASSPPRSPLRTRLAPLSASPSFDSKLNLAKDAGVEMPEARGCGQQVLATLRFNVEQPTMLLLIPVNGGFGYASALLHGVINCDLSTAILGKSSLGFLMAGSIGVAIITSWISSCFPEHQKHLLICDAGVKLLFATCIAVGFAFGLPSDELLELARRSQGNYSISASDGHNDPPDSPVLAAWWPILLVLYATYGLIRGFYESVLKCLTADLFPRHKDVAFANIYLQQACFQVFGFLLAPQMTWTVNVVFIVILALIQIPCVIALGNADRPYGFGTFRVCSVD